MAIAVRPVDALRTQLQEAVSQPGLAPAERIALLRNLRDSLNDLMGQADSYIGDVELLREADYLSVAEAVMLARSNASIRDELVERGMATPEQLDEAGYVSHEQLDRLRDEGRLIESVENLALFTSDSDRLREGFFGDIVHFDPKLHPRDRRGKFSDVLGKLAPMGTARLPNNVQVKKHENGGFTVHHPEGSSTHTDAKDAAGAALGHNDALEPKVEAGTGTIHLPPKGRGGGGTPRVLHSHPQGDQKVPESAGGAPEAGAPDAAAAVPGEIDSTVAPLTAAKPWKPVLDKVTPPDSLGGDPIKFTFSSPPTPEEIQSNLEKAQELGLNTWPTKGDVATHLLGDAKDTEELHTVPDASGKRVYTPERSALHEQIFDTLLRQRKADSTGELSIPDPQGKPLTAPSGKPVALFMAGGTASGKSTALKLPENKDVQPKDAVHIDPDEMKSMLPEYADMVAGGDKYAASGVHEESSYLAKELQKRAIKKGLNVIVDGTGDSQVNKDDPASHGKFMNKLTAFDQQGYDLHAFYVNAATDIAVIRSVQRAMKSGRWVPESEVRSIHAGVSQRFNGEIMDAINSGMLKGVKGYDTSNGDDPVLMFHLEPDGKFVVDDKATHDAFVGKANQAKV